MNQARAANLLILLGVLSTSISAILIRWAGAPAASTAFWRLALAFLTLVFLYPRTIKAIRWQVIRVAWLPGLFLALHFGLWIKSLDHASIAVSVLFVATHPLFAVFFAAGLLREFPRPRSYVGLVLTLFGVGFWFYSAPSEGSTTGALLALGGGAASAIYLVIGRRVRSRVPFLAYWMAVNGIAASALALWVMIQAKPFLGFSSTAWLAFLLMAWIPHLAGHGLFNWAIRRSSSLAVNTAVLGEPVLASLWAWLLFQELPPATAWFVGPCIMMGVLWVLISES